MHLLPDLTADTVFTMIFVDLGPHSCLLTVYVANLNSVSFSFVYQFGGLNAWVQIAYCLLQGRISLPFHKAALDPSFNRKTRCTHPRKSQ
jgi:hypothetical protein